MSRNISNYIWYEKHRPFDINSLSLDPHHKTAFESYIKQGDIPHILLAGPQGSGKTTIARILIEAIPSVCLPLNASSKERGIETVKGLIREFSASQPRKGHIKIVFMDEADGLTREALEALKGTMEEYSHSCKFILTCNNIDKIIPPIQSRCTPFKFERFPKKKVVGLCRRILKKEEIDVNNVDDIKELVDKFYPDIRSVINHLQLASISGELDLSTLTSLKMDPTQIGVFLMKGHVFSLREYIANVTDFTFAYRWLYDAFLKDHGSSEQKGEMVIAISESLAVDRQVPDREINFMACCLSLMNIMGVDWDFNA